MLKKIISLYTIFIAIAVQSTHITFISPQFSSHFYTLQKAAIGTKELHPEYEIAFIILEYTKNSLSQGIAQLEYAGIQIITHTEKLLCNFTENYIFYIKNLALSVQNTDLIIYDHWILEAEIIGRYLNITTICSITEALAPYNHMINTLKAQKNKKEKKFKEIEEIFHISCFDDLEWKFNHLILPSKHTNILYGYPLLVQSRNSVQGRNLNTVYCAIDKKPLIQNENFIIPKNDAHQKLIYLSFGGGNQIKDFLKDFLKNIFNWLAQSFGNNDTYIFIWANAGTLKAEFESIPSNFYVYENKVPQEYILENTDLFITHAGAHSINEAITHEIPMLTIPLLHNQHFAAKHIAQSNLGKSFLHPESLENKAIFSSSKLAERPSLTKESLKNTILEILDNPKPYKENIRRIKEVQPQNFVEIIDHIIKESS